MIDENFNLDITELMKRIRSVLLITGIFFAIVFSLVALYLNYNERIYFESEVKVIDNQSSSLSQQNDNSIFGMFGISTQNIDLTSEIINTTDFIESFLEQSDFLTELYTLKSYDLGKKEPTYFLDRVNQIDNIGKTLIVESVIPIFKSNLEIVASKSSTTLKYQSNNPQLTVRVLNDFVDFVNLKIKEREKNKIETSIEKISKQLEVEKNLFQIQSLTSTMDKYNYELYLIEGNDEYKFEVIDAPRLPKNPIFSSNIVNAVLFSAFLTFIIFSVLVLFYNQLSRYISLFRK